MLAGLILVLLAVWLLPDSTGLKLSYGWFPTWLHSLTEFFAVSVSLLVFSVTWHSLPAANVILVTVHQHQLQFL